MIVGRGMVAGALKHLAGWEEDILFSSGVSNSGEQASSAYQKEIDLLKTYLLKLPKDATFVYFSTTSIFDPSKSTKPYIIHKLAVEKILKESNVKFLIVRLPNLVGFSSNPHTLTNFFAESIRLNRPISLDRNAIRHLIDVEDLSLILDDIKKKFGKSKITVNVETDKPLSAGKILELMENVIMKKATIQLVDEINTINGSLVRKDTEAISYLWKTGENYHADLFRKYYSN